MVARGAMGVLMAGGQHRQDRRGSAGDRHAIPRGRPRQGPRWPALRGRRPLRASTPGRQPGRGLGLQRLPRPRMDLRRQDRPPGSPPEGIAGLFRFRENGPRLPRRLPPGHRRHTEQVHPSPPSRTNGRRERPGDHRDRRWWGQTHFLREPADGRPAVLGRQRGRRHSPRPRRHLSGNRLHRQTPVHIQPQNGGRPYPGRRRRPLDPRQRHPLRPLLAQGKARLTSAEVRSLARTR